MIDLHNHLLPGLDDGAPDLATALALARLAEQSGVTHLVCTPHILPGRYDNTRAGIAEARQAFAAAVAAAGLALQVAAAAEVRFGAELMQAVADEALPFLGHWQGRRVLLLEFPDGAIPFAAERLTAWLLERDIVPLLAHPERNKGVLHAPARLQAFLDQGCLLQVTAASLSGRFGPAVQRLAEDLLQAGAVAVLASDAHNVAHRPPALDVGRACAERLVGAAQAERLVRHTPWEITAALFA